MRDERFEAILELAPPKMEMEELVEGCTTCAKCAKGVRATVRDVQPSSGMTSDAEFLVYVRCRDAGCSWETSHWRPWSHRRPKEI